MRRVILESPYAGNIERNVKYARRCLLDCLERGEAPIASHLLFTQILDDTKTEDRKLGIDAGLAWVHVADAMVIYVDYGISGGMIHAMSQAERYNVPIESRMIGLR